MRRVAVVLLLSVFFALPAVAAPPAAPKKGDYPRVVRKRTVEKSRKVTRKVTRVRGKRRRGRLFRRRGTVRKQRGCVLRRCRR